MTLAHIKRFLEIWRADESFRNAYEKKPEAALKTQRLEADVTVLNYLIEEKYQKNNHISFQNSPKGLTPYQQSIEERLRWLNEVRSLSDSTNDSFSIWRKRQMIRNNLEIGHRHNSMIFYAPWAVELSEGCSVGCWFCGVSALKHKNNFLYTPKNAALWEDVLQIFSRTFGKKAASQGFCYWATDPLDNPDYEAFIEDFYRVLGRLPQTTTAQPLKNIERMKKLIQYWKKCDADIQRFSLIKRDTFTKVLQTFSPEELEKVELVMQFDNSIAPKAIAGRTRDLLKKRKKPIPKMDPNTPNSTIACIAGFLVNMVKKTVKLIAPCAANDKWPLGYIVFAEKSFTSASSLEKIVEDMSKNCMKTHIEMSDLLALNPVLKVEEKKEALIFSSPFDEISYEKKGPFYPLLKEIIEKKQTAKDLAESLAKKEGKDFGETFSELNLLFQKGLFDETLFIK